MQIYNIIQVEIKKLRQMQQSRVGRLMGEDVFIDNMSGAGSLWR